MSTEHRWSNAGEGRRRPTHELGALDLVSGPRAPARARLPQPIEGAPAPLDWVAPDVHGPGLAIRDDVATDTAKIEREVLVRYLTRANEQLRAQNADLVADRRRWARLALFDRLTGLANRQLLEHSLERALGRARRAASSIAVAFIDLDRLKEINDVFGHAAGDELLASFADRLRAHVRYGDLAARWGGDEFVVLAEPITHDHDLEDIALRILDAAQACPVRKEPVTASVGVAVCDGRVGVEPSDVLQLADRLLYRAKGAGGDRYLISSV
ncbi:MAG: GGDEF domain-containing protein [Actinomycetota bacterium]|nr:GGDEF domain-containing protein [Actinomycetota bacterium]